jgi:hypothetical protein
MLSAGRPCKFCLGLQDDSVFADFDLDENGCITLLRISFDGFGCCRTAGEVRPMSPKRSRQFINLVENNDMSDSLAAMLIEYFTANSEVIWKDALKRHGLLNC